MFFNWIRSLINCFDQFLENINGLCFQTSKRNRFEFFSCEKVDSKIWTFTSSLGFQREWNRIAIVLISVCTVNKCNPFWIYCNFGVELPMSVVCSWGGQDQYSWCVLPKGVCFLKGLRSLLWWFVFCNLIWLLSGLPNGFRGTRCSSWLKSEPV